MLIQIIRGTFGHRVGERVVAVTAAHAPIEVADAVAQRLISCGVAKAVEAPKAEEKTETQVDDGVEAVTFPEFDEGMTRAKLEEIALSVGIEQAELDKCRNKGQVLDLLEAARDEFDAEGAPSFDPVGDVL